MWGLGGVQHYHLLGGCAGSEKARQKLSSSRLPPTKKTKCKL